MSFSSMIQVLKVDPPKAIKTRDGNEFTAYTAQTALLSDEGELLKVGELRLSDAIRESVKTGVFRASFSLEVAQWGKNKGEVIAVLTGLVPVQSGKPPAPAQPAQQQPSAKG